MVLLYEAFDGNLRKQLLNLKVWFYALQPTQKQEQCDDILQIHNQVVRRFQQNQTRKLHTLIFRFLVKLCASFLA